MGLPNWTVHQVSVRRFKSARVSSSLCVCVPLHLHAHRGTVPCRSNVRFTPNGKFILACSLDSIIRLWSPFTEKAIKTYSGHTNAKCASPCLPSSRSALADPKRQVRRDTIFCHECFFRKRPDLCRLRLRRRAHLPLGRAVAPSDRQLASPHGRRHRCGSPWELHCVGRLGKRPRSQSLGQRGSVVLRTHQVSCIIGRG